MKRFFSFFLSICFFYHSSFGFYPSRKINSINKDKATQVEAEVLGKEEQARIEKNIEAERLNRERIKKAVNELEGRMAKQRSLHQINNMANRSLHLSSFILVLTVVGLTLHQIEVARHSGLPFSMKWLNDTVWKMTGETLNDGHFWAGLAGASTVSAALGGLYVGKEKLKKLISKPGRRTYFFKKKTKPLSNDFIRTDSLKLPDSAIKQKMFKKQFKTFISVGAITLITFLGWELGGVIYKKAALKAQEKRQKEIQRTAIIDFLVENQYERFSDREKVRDFLVSNFFRIVSEQITEQEKMLLKKGANKDAIKDKIESLKKGEKQVILYRKSLNRVPHPHPIPITRSFMEENIPDKELDHLIGTYNLFYKRHKLEAALEKFYVDIVLRNKREIFTVANTERIKKELIIKKPKTALIKQLIDVKTDWSEFVSKYYRDFSDKERSKLIENSKILSAEEKELLTQYYKPNDRLLKMVNESKRLTEGDKKEYKEIMDDPLLYQKFITNIKESFFDFKRTRNDRIFSAVGAMIQDENSSVIYDTARNNIFTGEFLVFVMGLWVATYSSSQIAKGVMAKTGLMHKLGVKSALKRTAIGVGSFLFMTAVLSGFVYLIPADTQRDITLWFKSKKQHFTSARLETKKVNFKQKYHSWINKDVMSMNRFQKQVKKELRQMRKEREEFADAYMRNITLLIHSLVQKYSSVALINQTLSETETIDNTFMSIFFQTAKSFNSIDQALSMRKDLSCPYSEEETEKCRKEDELGFLMFNELDEDSKQELRKERLEIKKQINDLNEKISTNYHHLVEVYGKQLSFFADINSRLLEKRDKLLENQENFSLSKKLSSSKTLKLIDMLRTEMGDLVLIKNFHIETFRPFLYLDSRSCVNRYLLGDHLLKDRLNKINNIGKRSKWIKSTDRYSYKEQVDQFRQEASALRSYIFRVHGPIIEYIDSGMDQLYYFSEVTFGMKYKEADVLKTNSNMRLQKYWHSNDMDRVIVKWNPNPECLADLQPAFDFIDLNSKRYTKKSEYKTFIFSDEKIREHKLSEKERKSDLKRIDTIDFK